MGAHYVALLGDLFEMFCYKEFFKNTLVCQ